MYPGLSLALFLHISLSFLHSRCLSFFLADWDVNPHPTTSRHVTFLPTASTHLPNYRSSRKKREGNLSVRTMRILRSASVYGLRNVLSSFILIRLFSRIVNENNRISRRLTSIAEGPRESFAVPKCLNLSCHLMAFWCLSGCERIMKFVHKILNFDKSKTIRKYWFYIKYWIQEI